MSKKFVWLILVVIFSLGAVNLEAKSFEWHTDYAKAQKLSVKEKLPMLLFFTGSDWCHWCKVLKAEVLSKPEFKKWAAQNVVAVKIDFPQDFSKHTKANEKLAIKYGVDSFPTIIFVKSDGKVIAKTSYIPGGAKNYVKHLEKLLK